MSRWVDADELTSTIEYDKEALSDFSKEWHNGLSYALSHISSAKNIDIVRCKDCIDNDINCSGTENWCLRFGYDVYDDDFCSYGEARENE